MMMNSHKGHRSQFEVAPIGQIRETVNIKINNDSNRF